MVKFYTGNILPEPDNIFVFGSNPEGRHGAGAALTARLLFGAVPGQGEGLHLEEIRHTERPLEHQDITGPSTFSTVTYVTCSTTWDVFKEALRGNDLPASIGRSVQVLGGQYLTIETLKRFLDIGGNLKQLFNPGLEKVLNKNRKQ